LSAAGNGCSELSDPPLRATGTQPERDR